MKKLIFLLVLLFFFNLTNSQENLNDYIEYKPSVPEATHIEKYGDYSPPNAFGVVPINLPITQIQSGTIKIPVSLSYSAGSGIRVNDRPSVVGLGWNLSTLDNYVEIIVEGSSQDFGKVYNSYSDYQEIENRYQVNNLDSIWKLNNQLKSNALSRTFLDRDYINDKMNYSFLGHSGAIIKDSLGVYHTVTSSQNDLEIIRHAYNDLEIIDGNGNHYIFNREIIYKPDNEVEAVRKRLYLTKIVLYNGEEIFYNYSDTDPNSDYHLNKSWMRTVMFEESVDNGGGVLQISDFTPPYSQFSSSNINAENNTLKEITFSNGKVEFLYTTSGTFLLKTIKVYDKGAKLIEHYKINNGNTYKNPSGVDVAAKLLSIEKVAPDAASSYNLYEFNYDESPIPSRYSTKGDYWGYNNGYTTTVPDFSYFYGGLEYDFNGDNRSPNFNSGKAGILKEIIYPTRGKSIFYYEPNYYSVEELVTTTSAPTSKNINLTAIGQNPSVSSYTPIDSTSFYLDRKDVYSTGGITVTFVSSRFTKNSAQYPYYKITAPDGTIYTRVFNQENEKNSGTFDITNISTGTYKVVAYVGDASLYPNDPQPSIFNTASLELTLSWKEYPKDEPPQYQDVLVKGGGLRIKKIENYTTLTSSSPAKIRSFEYGERQVDGIGVGDFLGLKNQTSIISNINANTTGENHIITNFLVVKDIEDRRWYNGSSGQGAFVATYHGDGLQLGSDPLIPIEYKGHSVFYPKVTIYNTESKSTLGFTEQFFVKPKHIEVRDVMGDFSSSTSAQIELSKYSDYSGAHLIKEIAFNSNNDTVSLKEYDYQKYLIYEQPILKIKSSDKTLTISGSPISAFPDEIAEMSKTNIKVFYLKEKIYLEKLVSTSQISFFNGQNVETSSGLTYLSNNSFRIKEKKTVDSKGRNISQIYSFPDQVVNINSLGHTPLSSSQLADYNNLTAQNIHKINDPVQVEETVKLINNTVFSAAVQRTYYGAYQNKLYPASIYSAKKDEILESKLEFNHYDSSGNPLEVSREDGPPIVYIWGYNNQFPVAKVENATYAAIENLSYFGPDFSLGGGGLSSNQENSLRAGLSNALITTYEYEPLVGITKITDPKGQVTTYHYDNFNRLEFIKDDQGNLLKEHTYHFKN